MIEKEKVITNMSIVSGFLNIDELGVNAKEYDTDLNYVGAPFIWFKLVFTLCRSKK